MRIAVLVAPLRRPRLRRLVGAFLVNELGDGISVVVLPLLVYGATRSGLLTGVVFAGLRVVGVVGRPVGGLLADRVDRLRVLRTTFLVRGGLLTLGLAAGSDATLIVCLVLTAFVGTIDNPSGEAAIREGAGDQALQVAAIRKVSRAVSGVVGMAVGGIVVAAVGERTAVAIDVATYLAAVVLLPAGASRSTGARESRAGRTGLVVAARREVARSIVDAREGLRHLRAHPDLGVIAGTEMLAAGVVTALLTVAVVWLDGQSGAPRGGYGIALAAYSAGAIVGLAVAGTVAWHISIPKLAARTLAVSGIVCALGVVGSDWRVLSASWLAWGIAWGPLEVWGDTRVVALTPDALLGRTYGGIGMLAALGQVIGGVSAGLLADVVDPRTVIVGLGGILVVASTMLAAADTRDAPPAG